MNSFINQALLVNRQNILSISNRLSDAWITIIATSGVVLVFIGILSIAVGFSATNKSTASDNNVIILRSGSNSEMDSGLNFQQIQAAKQTVGFRFKEDKLLFSPELYLTIDLKKHGSSHFSNVPFRGVSEAAPLIRDKFKIVEGRYFQYGKKELIAGIGAASQFSGLELDSKLKIGKDSWTVVGIFSTDGGVTESELWADVTILQSLYRRGNSYSSIYAKLLPNHDASSIHAEMKKDPRLTVDVIKEADYYHSQSQVLTRFVFSVGFLITILMSIAASFGAINTMYNTIAKRKREIATMRVFGINSFAIASSVFIEAIFLCLIGGLIGGLLALALFNGKTVSTINFASFSQVVFSFSVSPMLIFLSMLLSLLIGLLGGILPAYRAMKLNVVDALKDL